MTYSPFYYSVADCSRTSKGKPVSRTWHRGFYHSERRLWYVLTFALSTYQRGGQSSPLLTFLSCEQVKEIQTYVGLKKLATSQLNRVGNQPSSSSTNPFDIESAQSYDTPIKKGMYGLNKAWRGPDWSRLFFFFFFFFLVHDTTWQVSLPIFLSVVSRRFK